MFTQLCETILPIEWYCGMVGVLVYQKVLEILLKERFPRMVAHMEEQFYHIDMLALNWLIALFFDVVSADSEKFIFTALLLKGPKILLQVAMILIHNLEE